MKEINIAKVIQKKRKERHLTQDDIAAYIGVSKASVSKWETAQSYPDITFLPQLAALVNISIDELDAGAVQGDHKRILFLLSAAFADGDPAGQSLYAGDGQRRAAEDTGGGQGAFCQDQGGERGD